MCACLVLELCSGHEAVQFFHHNDAICCCAETAVSPAMPSTTARAGGIFMPIIKFLSTAQNSNDNDPSRKRLGAFLVQSQLQTSSFSSAVFLTASAQNLLCLNLAAKLGAVVPNPWMTWFIGAFPPALIGLIITPLLLFKLYPPEVWQCDGKMGAAQHCIVLATQLGKTACSQLPRLLELRTWVVCYSVVCSSYTLS